jgi:hypothetical protein
MTDVQGAAQLATVSADAPLESEEPSVAELEDLLYDILASGADPSMPPDTLAAVQTFIHEHARGRHTRAEFLAFFAQHKLSTAKEDTLTFALPPMDPREPRSAPLETTQPENSEAIAVAQAVASEPAITKAPMRSAGLAWIWAAALVALAAISGVAYFAVVLARAELERVRSEARANAALIERVQAETANLRQSVQQNAELVRRVDHKSELLLQTLVSPLDPNTR